MIRISAAATSAIGAILTLALVAFGGHGGVTPSAEAIEDIPPAYLVLYQDAVSQRCPTLPWVVLAAIGKIESDHGRTAGAGLGGDGRVSPPIVGVALDGSAGTQEIRDTDGGLFDGDRVYDRAVGPMQFIPTTWAVSGIDGSGDGFADPHNATDAVHSAAAYLCSVGANDPSNIRDAVWAYNRSWEYVDAVLAQASLYADGGFERMQATPTLIALVLSNPRLDIYPEGRQDIAAGRIDARILTVLQLASERHTISVSSLKTGHSRCVGGGDRNGCTVSHHWHGRGADISMVDGRLVTAGNRNARALALWLAELPAPLRPDEVGTPWAELSHLPGFFSDPAHADHLHLGTR